MVIAFFGINLVTLGLSIAVSFAIYLALSLSLNFELGFAGIPDFGKALFIAAGATFGGSFAGFFASWYLKIGEGKFVSDNINVAGQLNGALAQNVEFSIVLLLSTLAVAAAVGAVFGYAISVIAIRLKEVYLSMTFFAFAQFFGLFAQNYTPLAGGNLGIYLPDPFAWAGDNRFIVAAAVLLIFAFLTFVFFNRMTQSPLGRMLRSIRDDRDAAAALGKDVISAKTKVLIISSAVSGMIGVLYGFYTGDVLGGSYDSTVWTFWPWVIVVIGGVANNYGVAAGTILFWSVLDAVDLSKYSFQNYIPFSIVWLEYILVGLLLIIILRTRATGLIRERPSVRVTSSEVEAITKKEDADLPANPEPDQG